MDNSNDLTSDVVAFDLVIFGGTGDLATRKLLPALLSSYQHGNIPNKARIITVGRKELSQANYCKLLRSELDKDKQITDDVWHGFSQHLHYLMIEATNYDNYNKLAKFIDSNKTNIYYLATEPALFKTICENLAKQQLNHANSRIVLEKPLGHDLQSSNDINHFVGKYFSEQQIYRIDHYLGKESVQNLMAIRFGNTLFEALWRRQWISSIQITIAETLGVNSRGEFYEKTGAIRDMLQNHLLQLLCIVAMEPPYSLEADTVRDEKLKVLKSLKPLTEEDVLNNVILGQYKAGAIDGVAVKGYLDEEAVGKNSSTETFVAIKAEIQNWRWASVPFYLRTGKRLQDRVAEIVIQFKDIPCKIFPFGVNNFANRLIIRLQPEESVQCYFLAKKPGATNELEPVYLDLNFNKMLSAKTKLEDYERLLMDVARGNLTLFVRHDEQAAAWKWVEPIFTTSSRLKLSPKHYSAGTWGPVAASAMLAKDNACWHEELV